MSAAGWALGAAVALPALALGRGWLELRRSAAAARASLARIGLDEVPALAAEGRAVLRDRLDVTLSDDPAEAAQQLDTLVRSPRIKDAFARPDLYWHFVRPLGALAGELVRSAGQARWVDGGEAGPSLRVTLADGRELTARPFERVLRHRQEGKPGALRDYLLFAAGRFEAGARSS